MNTSKRRDVRGLEKRPTWTSLTVNALAQADDFLTRLQIIEATKGSPDQVSAALSHLKKFRVVDCLESGGRLYWFLTGEDDRTFVCEEKVKEEPGTRNRKSGYRSKKMRGLRLVPKTTPDEGQQP